MKTSQTIGHYLVDILGVEYGSLMDSEISLDSDIVDNVVDLSNTQVQTFQSEIINFSEVAKEKKFKVVFLSYAGNTEYSAFQENHYELFQKMRAAMKLQPEEAPLIETTLGHENEIPKYSAQCLVLFEEHVSLREWSHHNEIDTMRVPSPGFLTYHPAEKKEAWTRLQMVLEHH